MITKTTSTGQTLTAKVDFSDYMGKRQPVVCLTLDGKYRGRGLLVEPTLAIRKSHSEVAAIILITGRAYGFTATERDALTREISDAAATIPQPEPQQAIVADNAEKYICPRCQTFCHGDC